MRDQTIDIAKGIGIFLVVLGHSSQVDSAQYHYIYLFHMPLFFFLSGMYAKQLRLKDCMRKRTPRLIVPYVFYRIYTYIYSYIMNMVSTRDFSIQNISFNLLDGGVLWFLLSLWTIHFIYSIGSYLGRWQWALYVVGISLGLINAFNKVELPLYVTQSLIMLPFFLLGKFFIL